MLPQRILQKAGFAIYSLYDVTGSSPLQRSVCHTDQSSLYLPV